MSALTSGAIEIRDRLQAENIYQECFVGYEACSAFIQAKFVKTRPEAVQLGMVLMKNGLIEHCTKSSVFEDGFVFYKLTKFSPAQKIASELALAAQDDFNDNALNAKALRAAMKILADNKLYMPLKPVELATEFSGGGGQGDGDDWVDDYDILLGLETVEEAPAKDKKGIKAYCQAHGQGVAFTLIYLAVTGLVVWEAWETYSAKPIYEHLGYSLIVARMTVNLLFLNCFLLLFPVSRIFISWMRTTWLEQWIPLGRNIRNHAVMARVICFSSLIHTISHVRNLLIIVDKIEEINPMLYTQFDTPPTFLQLNFCTVAGITGHIMNICLVCIFITALQKFRNYKFHVFWNTHHLFIVFFSCLCIHGSGQILGTPKAGYVMAAPLLLYGWERAMRVRNAEFKTTTLLKVYEEPSNVLRLDFRQKGFFFKAGQYVFLKCPHLSETEWHPFSITAAPDDPYVSLHIKQVGDWTKALAKFLNPEKQRCVTMQTNEAPNGRVLLQVDGPFGAPSEHVFQFETCMLVGAGIGVTPFASILKNVRNKFMNFRNKKGCCQADTCRCNCACCTFKTRRVYFYWVNRDTSAFEWFAELLIALEDDVRGEEFLEMNIFMTGKIDEKKKERTPAGRDGITGLVTQTTFKRPNWDQIFAGVRDRHMNEEVGVFFCGPKALSKMLKAMTNKYTDPRHTRFNYHKENF